MTGRDGDGSTLDFLLATAFLMISDCRTLYAAK